MSGRSTASSLRIHIPADNNNPTDNSSTLLAAAQETNARIEHQQENFNYFLSVYDFCHDHPEFAASGMILSSRPTHFPVFRVFFPATTALGVSVIHPIMQDQFCVEWLVADENRPIQDWRKLVQPNSPHGIFVPQLPLLETAEDVKNFLVDLFRGRIGRMENM